MYACTYICTDVHTYVCKYTRQSRQASFQQLCAYFASDVQIYIRDFLHVYLPYVNTRSVARLYVCACMCEYVWCIRM